MIKININMDFENGVATIDHMINNLPRELQTQERKCLNKIGAVIKKNVKKHLSKSNIEARLDEEPKNYDGSRPYVHMKDDVKSSVRKNKMGDLYVSVRGGKLTGFKWHMLNNGHLSKDGKTFVPGTKFIDHAIQDSEGEVGTLIDEMLRQVVG